MSNINPQDLKLMWAYHKVKGKALETSDYEIKVVLTND